MYISKYDKNNIQTRGRDDIILVSQIRSTKSNCEKTTYFDSGPGFFDTQYICFEEFIVIFSTNI